MSQGWYKLTEVKYVTLEATNRSIRPLQMLADSWPCHIIYNRFEGLGVWEARRGRRSKRWEGRNRVRRGEEKWEKLLVRPPQAGLQTHCICIIWHGQ